MTTPRLNEVELRAVDPEASLRVYRDMLGIPFQEHEHDGGPRHWHTAWGEGDAFLFFSLNPCEEGEETRTCLGFAVTGLDQLHEKMQREGFRVLQDIEARPWGSRTSLYESKDGNRIWLSEG
jgi:predicted enzyme related to lactoylglutathione lyase